MRTEETIKERLYDITQRVETIASTATPQSAKDELASLSIVLRGLSEFADRELDARGVWGNKTMCECSLCGMLIPRAQADLYDYCPYCGAWMHGEE